MLQLNTITIIQCIKNIFIIRLFQHQTQIRSQVANGKYKNLQIITLHNFSKKKQDASKDRSVDNRHLWKYCVLQDATKSFFVVEKFSPQRGQIKYSLQRKPLKTSVFHIILLCLFFITLNKIQVLHSFSISFMNMINQLYIVK